MELHRSKRASRLVNLVQYNILPVNTPRNNYVADINLEGKKQYKCLDKYLLFI